MTPDSETKGNTRGFHGPLVAAASSLLIAMTVTVYASLTPPNSVPSPQSAASLVAPASGYLVVFAVATAAILFDLLRYSRRRGAALMEAGVVPLSPSSIGPYLLSQRRYWSAFAASAILYGVLYSFLTSIVVYRPDVSFAALPGLAIPSVQPDQLVGTPLYVPEMTVFLTDHVALVLIPLTLMLMAAISILVGFNVALAAFAYDNRARGGGSSWGGQLGAIVGLFTGCPTCAGLYFFSLLGGSGAVSFAVALGYYQPLFIVLSIPILLGAPYLTSRTLSKLFREGCVIVPPGGHHRP